MLSITSIHSRSTIWTSVSWRSWFTVVSILTLRTYRTTRSARSLPTSWSRTTLPVLTFSALFTRWPIRTNWAFITSGSWWPTLATTSIFSRLARCTLRTWRSGWAGRTRWTLSSWWAINATTRNVVGCEQRYTWRTRFTIWTRQSIGTPFARGSTWSWWSSRTARRC